MNISECCIAVLLGLDRHIQPHPHGCSGFVNPLRADSVDLAYITPVCDVSYKRVGLEARPTGMGSNLRYLSLQGSLSLGFYSAPGESQLSSSVDSQSFGVKILFDFICA